MADAIMEKLDPFLVKFKEFCLWAIKGPLGVLAGGVLTLDSIYGVFKDSSEEHFLRVTYDFIMIAFGLMTFYVEADMKALPYAEAAKDFLELYFGFVRFLLGRGIMYVVVAFLEFSHSDSVLDNIVGSILLLVGIFSIIYSQSNHYEEIESTNLDGSMFKDEPVA